MKPCKGLCLPGEVEGEGWKGGGVCKQSLQQTLDGGLGRGGL